MLKGCAAQKAPDGVFACILDAVLPYNGGIALENGIEIGTVLRYGLITLGLFVLIYLIAEFTPKLAKLVDAWIAKYRENHDPKKNRAYGVRSIYELPPKSEDTEAPADEQQDSQKERNQ